MKKKVIIVSIVALIMLVLLIPRPRYLNDGGTIEYKALLYNVTKLNKLNYHSSTGYDRGTKIEILGIEVYNDIVIAEPTIINMNENYQKYSKTVRSRRYWRRFDASYGKRSKRRNVKN